MLAVDAAQFQATQQPVAAVWCPLLDAWIGTSAPQALEAVCC